MLVQPLADVLQEESLAVRVVVYEAQAPMLAVQIRVRRCGGYISQGLLETPHLCDG
jgi:hypothetical protein